MRTKRALGPLARRALPNRFGGRRPVVSPGGIMMFRHRFQILRPLLALALIVFALPACGPKKTSPGALASAAEATEPAAPVRFVGAPSLKLRQNPRFNRREELATLRFCDRVESFGEVQRGFARVKTEDGQVGWVENWKLVKAKGERVREAAPETPSANAEPPANETTRPEASAAIPGPTSAPPAPKPAPPAAAERPAAESFGSILSPAPAEAASPPQPVKKTSPASTPGRPKTSPAMFDPF